jgi:hypothetical protein
MHKRIRKDLERYKRIVRGEIRKNLRDLVETGEIVGQRGNDIVKIPVKSIKTPEFRFDPRDSGGIGSGDGQVGDPVKADQGQEIGDEAGQVSGPHVPEVELELQELAQILGEELELPRIEPKGNSNRINSGDEYTDVAIVGPDSLMMKRRAFREALKRNTMLNGSNETNRFEPAVVTPIKEDFRFLYSEPNAVPEANAVILYMRDASGSMSGEKTEIIRHEMYWIDLWLRTHYDNVERAYILHDYEAYEVDENNFYELSTGGGTRISSAYELCAKIIDLRYPAEEWNIYPFHFSDGENWIGDTENYCVPVLRDHLLPKSNMFCYGQVTLGRRSPGLHLVKLQEKLDEEDGLITSVVAGREDILGSIKEFLGKGS